MRQDNKRNWSGGDRGDRRSGGRSFSKGGFGGGDRQMHKTICSDCGMECEVPFKPTGEKPVYCSNCFDKKGGSRGSDRRSGGNFSSRSAGGDQNKEQLEKIALKLDQILEVLKDGASVVKVPAKKEVKEESVSPTDKKKVVKAPAKKVAKKTVKPIRQAQGKKTTKKK
jgi:CxxC-x17-CxxC domain-containing protein